MTSLHSNNPLPQSWIVGSRCLIFSRTQDKWFEGKITLINGFNNDEWLTVKYGNTKKNTKRIQRNCKYIKPLPCNHPSQFIIGSKCQIYSDITLSWCYGTIIDIYNDIEGEWLKVKYNEKTSEKICDIQRYSKDFKLISNEEFEEKMSVNHRYVESNAKDLDTFQDIKHILIDQQKLEDRITTLGNEITKYYTYNNANINDELICIGILNGGFMFCADLIRHIKIPHRVEFMKLKSYT
eukprot:1010996_1